MGYDIKLIMNNTIVAETYLSFNFYKTLDSVGYCMKDITGRESKIVGETCEKIITLLWDKGFKYREDDGTPNWAWGDNSLPWHLKRFIRLAKDHPGAMWYDDYYHEEKYNNVP